MDVELKFAGGMTFLGRGESNHWVPMDAKESAGGAGAGPSPMELLLMAVGGCTGMDVVSILRKKRVELDGFEIKIHGERAEEHPKAYRRITLEYVFYGRDLPRRDLERAVELSQEKYCGASATVRGVAAVDWKVTVREPVPFAPARREGAS